MHRILILGTGTAVGKTHVSIALAQSLRRADPALRVGLLKPIETGLVPETDGDASRLEGQIAGFAPPSPHPLYGFSPPISPHLAARRAGRLIRVPEVVDWVTSWERRERLRSGDVVLVETAGGVFSPLSEEATNFGLARALDPAIWLLVAPDALGVLHELSATLRALAAAGRLPDQVVLSAARGVDASTGTNGDELRRLGIADPVAVLGPGSDDAAALVPRILG